MCEKKSNFVSIILPAAGEGCRMQMQEKKQFFPVMGKPLISYTIENFEKLKWVGVILVVVSGKCRELMEKMVGKFKWRKVKVMDVGCSSRHRSILNALCLLPQEKQKENGVVVVHDAVRPVINLEDLQDVVTAAGLYGAAGLVRRLTSTILEADDGVMVRALNRDKLCESHTPQAFQYSVLRQAYERCSEWDLDYGTECLHLVHKYSSPLSPPQTSHVSSSSSSSSPSFTSSPSSSSSLPTSSLRHAFVHSTTSFSSSPIIRLIEATTLFNKITYKEDLEAFEFYLHQKGLNESADKKSS